MSGKTEVGVDAHAGIIQEAMDKSMEAFAEHLVDLVDENGLPSLDASYGTLAATVLTAQAASAIREHSKELVFWARVLAVLTVGLGALTVILIWRTFVSPT